MAKLKDLIAWREDKNRKMNDGIDLIKETDSKYTTYFRNNDKAKIGEMPFNMLDARVSRQIRLLSQNSKKKAESSEEIKDQPTPEEEAKKLMSLAKAAQTRADKTMEKADKETDEKKKKELEVKAEEAMQKAEDAMKIALEASENIKAE